MKDREGTRGESAISEFQRSLRGNWGCVSPGESGR